MNLPGDRRVLRLALAILALVPMAFAWDLVAVPYRNPQQIAGILAEQQFNPATNLLRFAIFVAGPALVWLLLAPPGRGLSDQVGSAATLEHDARATATLRAIAALGFLAATVLGLGRLADGTSDFYFDLFHDGDSLAPAFNWLARGHLWTEQQLTRGPLHDVFLPIAGWQLFGARTIGAFKAGQLLLEAIVPLALWGSAVWLQHSLRDCASLRQRILLLSVTLAIVSAGQWYGTVWFQARALIVLVWLAVLVHACRRRTPAWFVATGFAAFIALLTTTESGAYCVASSLVVLGASMSSRGWRESLSGECWPWLAGFSGGHLLIVLFLGSAEWRAWWAQMASTASRWDFIYGYEYPAPWPLYGEHAWPMVALALLLLVLAARTRSRGVRFLTAESDWIHVALVALSVVSYRTALGRSDAAHVRQGLAYASLGLGYTIWLLIRSAPGWTRQGVIAMAAIMMMSVTADALRAHGWSGLAGAPEAIWRYAHMPDQAFLSPAQQQALPVLRRASQDASCLFVFPNEPGWYYLLGKPTCGRFHFTVHASAADDQTELTRSLASARPAMIIYASPLPTSDVDGLSNPMRLSRVDAWIHAHYRQAADAVGWSIYRPR